MKKTLVFGIIAILAMATQAMAGTVVLTVNNPHDSSGGGPFTLTLTDGSFVVNGATLATAGSSFTSFCVEFNENFTPNNPYTAVINENEMAIQGGIDAAHGYNAALGGDPISKDAAWLFATYAQKTFATTQDATDFQQALWYLEQEIALTTPLDNTYLKLVANNFNGIDRTINATLGEYGVYVLNLTDASGGRHQDQLIHVPDGGFTVMLLGLGIGGLALFSRKLKT
jgi:hypothetical protein